MKEKDEKILIHAIKSLLSSSEDFINHGCNAIIELFLNFIKEHGLLSVINESDNKMEYAKKIYRQFISSYTMMLQENIERIKESEINIAPDGDIVISFKVIQQPDVFIGGANVH